MRREIGVLEKSFAASVRVDARDLAVAARWMREAGVGQVTRSGVLGFALRTLVGGILDKEPERTVTTIQDAFQELLELDMAPRSARDMMKLAQAMKLESMAWEGNSKGLENSLKKYVAGTGLADKEARLAASREMEILLGDKTMSDEVLGLGLSSDQADVVRTMARRMREQGDSKEDIADKIKWFVSTRKQAESLDQARSVERADDLKKRWNDNNEALDANSLTFQQDYQKREEEKLRELKANLGTPPVG